jgi:periplasmic protein TonB
MADSRSRIDEPEQSTSKPTLRFGRFITPNNESCLRGFVSNLREFLTQRPAKLCSSQLVAANDGWPRNIWTSASSEVSQFARIEALSVSIHVTILVLLLLPLLPRVLPPTAQRKPYTIASVADVSSFLKQMKAAAARKLGGGGGGGERNPLLASKGAVPPFSWNQLTPPRVRTPQNPVYAAPPTIVGPTGLKLLSPDMNNWGNPISPVINDSSGPGSHNGIGNGKGHGDGDGTDDGFGRGQDWGIGGDRPTSGMGAYSEVACVYCPTAQFSDEAVKAKFQGTVFLSLIVTADGRPTDIHIASGLGMGLDEKALEAVRKWRFKPSVGPDGKAAAVRAIVEVQFHLY